MSITPQAIADDPSLYLLDLQDEWLRLQEMTRDGFHRSIFLDNRIRSDGRQLYRVPVEPVLAGYDGPSPAKRPVGLIFHVAHCGSTLLARALDLPGRSLVLREPVALRHLGVVAGAGSQGAETFRSDDFKRRLSFTLSMLGKRWEKDSPVIVKANVPVNFIAREVLELEGRTPALLLYLPLSDYLAAVLRTESHGKWVESIVSEMRLEDSPWAAGAAPSNLAERAAVLWFAQMKAFEGILAGFPAARSLCASKLFGSPELTLEASAGFFGVDLKDGEAGEIARGEIFATYAKNPTLDYDVEVRAAREVDAKRRLSQEIDTARSWVNTARDRHGLVDYLDSPLFGETVPLID